MPRAPACFLARRVVELLGDRRQLRLDRRYVPAHDLDAIALPEASSDRGFGDICLAVHGAGDRAREFLGQAHHHSRIFLAASGEIGRHQDRTNEDERRQHAEFPRRRHADRHGRIRNCCWVATR